VKLKIRRLLTFVDQLNELAGHAGDPPLRKVAAVAVIHNPYAGKKFQRDLQPLVDGSKAVGEEITRLAMAALKPYKAESYGKAAIIGLAGEQEHGNALLTTLYGDVMRKAAGGGKAWISSLTKQGGPGTSIDIPLACKDALYVRSHYDGMSITLHDAPLPDEIAVICCYANRGRLNARVGGLAFKDVKGRDGLT
jgi:Amino acid synthesis